MQSNRLAVAAFWFLIALTGWTHHPRASHGAEPNEQDAAGLEFFEKRIRPVLVQHCYQCHSGQTKTPQGGLRVDSREAIRNGGESGHAVVPGDLDQSLLMEALRYESFEMPPSGPLDESIIDDFAAWIEMGAPDPRDEAAAAETPAEIDIEAGKRYWAFQSPQLPPLPPATDAWSQNDADRFLAAQQTAAGVTPVADADRSTLARRLYFDLIGLPPTPEQLRDFVESEDPDVLERTVDRLLDSPQFGERWGRHWLDVVRYAESTGRTRNFPYPYAWRYRDYVIDAFNRDLPFDQFVREQIAGDLLDSSSPEERDRQLIATGFLAIGAHDLNEANRNIYRMDVVGEQIDVMGRAIMGLTLGCARCHDHKFDPIPTQDYYALAGIFRSSELRNGYDNRRRNRQRADATLLVALGESSPPAAANNGQRAGNARSQADRELRQTQRRVQQLRNRQQELIGSVAPEGFDFQDRAQRQRVMRQLSPDDRQKLRELRRELTEAQAELRKLREREQAEAADAQEPLDGEYAMGVTDAAQIEDCPIHLGGEVNQLDRMVPRGFLQVIPLAGTPDIPADQSGRMQLAQWLTRPDHPLTSRVIVNRVWQHLFGQGIVSTVDNFGVMGGSPSHPELLDHLAVTFVQDGWSIKRLVRRLVTSRAYRLSDEMNERNYELDPDNRLVWRMPQRRLEAEAIRDAILQVSGELNLDRPEGSVVQQFAVEPVRRRDDLLEQLGDFSHRSVYLPIVRSRLPNYLTTFDFPEPSDVKGQRDVTTVAPQALFMMNSPLVQYHSRRTAQRLVSEFRRPRDMVEQAYLLTLNRPPTPEQLRRALAYMLTETEEQAGAPRQRMVDGLTDVVHALFATAEFRYR